MNRKEAKLYAEGLVKFAEAIGALVNDPNFNDFPREVRVHFTSGWKSRIVKNQATADSWVKHFQRKFKLCPYDFSWVEVIVRPDLRKAV